MDGGLNNGKSDDQSSLGILQMEHLKGNASSASSSRISERLNGERSKALAILQSSRQPIRSCSSLSGSSKDDKENRNKHSKATPKLDKTDYVPFLLPPNKSAINLSDLVTDETIHLESSSNYTPVAGRAGSKISFDPAEMTGRSTHYTHSSDPFGDDGAECRKPSRVSLSVEELLQSSMEPRLRKLGEAKRAGNQDLFERLRSELNASTSNRTQSYSSSTLSSFSLQNGSMLHTADMSRASLNSLGSGAVCSFASAAAANDSAFNSEEFEPGEMMQSKLLLDEISWAEQFAAIPAVALSDEAKAKKTAGVAAAPAPEAHSLNFGDPDFSMGRFFHQRSEKLCNMVTSKSPERDRTLYALVPPEETNDTITSSLVAQSDFDSVEMATPKIDNKTYSKPLAATGAASSSSSSVSSERLEQQTDNESKDSGNGSHHNSYLLSVSAIDRALSQLDLQADNSTAGCGGVINKILTYAKHPPAAATTDGAPLITEPQQRALTDLESIVELITANKENVDPEAMLVGVQHSDTLSFTESLLNSTELKHLTRSNQSGGGQARSPLSPIEIKVTLAEKNEDADADVDDWPSTPIKSPHRRVRRKKLSPELLNGAEADKDTTPTDVAQINTPSPVGRGALQQPAKVVKALSSTRLASQNGGGHVAGSSPNQSSICKSNTDHMAGSPSSQCAVAMSGASTSSSPFASESGSSRYGVAPTRSNSAASLRSLGIAAGGGVAAGRSQSRCSQSSEFSHRDGQTLPLKLTSMELSWGSTKLRAANVRKSLQVKNTSDKRLVVRVAAHGPGFQLAANMQQGGRLTLQSQECRTITLTFCPTVVGAAVGHLSFHAPQQQVPAAASNGGASPSLLDIPLYGYGGHAVLMPQHVAIGPVGSVFLTMGELQELATPPLVRTFKIHNRGPLLGYAVIALDSSGLHVPRLSDAFTVRPQAVLIQPDATVTVSVTFRPKRDDVRKIVKKIQTVLTLANMRIATGDEANRQRLRLHVQRLSAEERDRIAPASLHHLWARLPGEAALPDVTGGAFARESPHIAYDLMGAVNVREVALTLNHQPDLDDTVETSISSAFGYLDGDETVLFRTICVSPSITPPPPALAGGLQPVDEEAPLFEDAAVSSTTSNEDENESGRGWSVSPPVLAFDFFAERRQRGERCSLLLRNTFRSRQYFEAVCTHAGLLRLTPSEGYIQPDGGKIEIEVDTLLPLPPPQLAAADPVAIVVSMENERISVPVKIASDNFMP